MSQHFLLSRAAKSLSLATVFRMSDAEAETTFRKVRWPDTDGAPVCPHCGGVDPCGQNIGLRLLSLRSRI
jgi:hypothetical protein